MEMKVILSKTYNFEGKQYTEIDLTNLNNLTTLDLENAQRAMTIAGHAGVPELNIVYIEALLTAALGVPMEFFKGLPAKDMVALRNRVTAFLM